MPYTLLCLTTLACWLTDRKVLLLGLCGLVVASGLVFGRLELVGALWIGLYGLLAFILSKPSIPFITKIFVTIGLFIMSLGFMSHILPGFHNLIFFDSVHFSEKSSSFSMYLNLDKPFVGIFLLIFLGIPKTTDYREFLLHFKRVFKIYAVLLFVILIPAIATRYLMWDPKLPRFTWVWMVNNLLVVCVAEEVFFRGLIQYRLAGLLKKFRLGGWIAIIASSILFGLAHFKGGLPYVALSTLAGIFYGYAFYISHRIESAILVHFLLNLTHFLLFTYPAMEIIRS